MINIIGGAYKRKKINVPKKKVRPTSAIKREAIFSTLESFAVKNSYDLYNKKCFIDFFSGSGALGLEAISRGASFAYFYEFDDEVLPTLIKNCKSLCKESNYKIIKQDILQLKKIKLNFSLSTIFIDPPYEINPFEKILKIIINSNILNNESIIVIETENKKKIQIPRNLKKIKEKNYGKTKIIFLKNYDK